MTVKVESHDYSADITLTFNNVDKMSDEDFKTNLVRMINVKYPKAERVFFRANKGMTNCMDNTVDYDTKLSIEY